MLPIEIEVSVANFPLNPETVDAVFLRKNFILLISPHTSKRNHFSFIKSPWKPQLPKASVSSWGEFKASRSKENIDNCIELRSRSARVPRCSQRHLLCARQRGERPRGHRRNGPRYVTAALPPLPRSAQLTTFEHVVVKSPGRSPYTR